MQFIEELKKRYPAMYPPTAPAQTNPYQTEVPPVDSGAVLPVQSSAAPVAVAPSVDVQKIVNNIDPYLTALEQLTGMSRRELVLQGVKVGLRGGNISSLVDALTGARAPPEAKFVRYVKTLAVWVPVGLLLFGASMVAVFAFFKLAMILLGSV